MATGTNGPIAASTGSGTLAPGADPDIVPVVPPAGPPVPLDPPAGYVTINIPICIPISCLPPSGLSPAAGADPNLAVSNPEVVPGNESPGVRPTCEVQINNLVDMQIRKGVESGPKDRKKLVALEALKEWKEAQSGLEGKVERRTKQTDKLIFEIYQLVGLYSVFVGVVFTAALQSQSVQCQHIWSPVLLCVVAWLIIILVTIKRLKRYKALRVTIKSEENARAARYGQISKVKSYGYEGFEFTKDVNEIPATDFGGFLLAMADANVTKVYNDTNHDYYLKEGNNGDYRLLEILKKKTSTTIRCDLNATYREYWVGTAAGIPGAIISSDDCAECSEIRIVPSQVGRNDLLRTPRTPAATQADSTSDVATKKKKTCAIL